MLLVGVLIAAGALASGIPSVNAQTGNSDLTIVNLTADNPVYDGEEPVTVTATVKNLGPDETMTPSDNQVKFRYDESDRCLTGDSAIETCDQPFNNTDPIPPNATVNVTVEWTPQEDQIGLGTLIAILESSSEPDGAQGNNRMDVPVFVKEHNGTLSPIDDEERTAFPGQATPYRATLTNTGNVETTFNMNLTGPLNENGEPEELPEGWEATPQPSNVTLSPQESTTIVSLLEPPSDSEEDEDANATLWATTHTPAQHNASLSLPITTVETELPDEFEKSVTVEPLNASNFVGPAPGVYSVAWRVTNTGTLPDAYTFQATLQEDIAQRGHASPPPVIALNASENTTVQTLLHIEEPIPVGETGTHQLEAQSVNDPDSVQPTTAVHELTGSGPDLVVTDIAPPDPAYATEGNVTVRVTVENIANRPSTATNLTLEAQRSGFTTVSVTANLPPLAPNQEATLSVSLPVQDLAGDYVLLAEANQPKTFNETQEHNNQAQANVLVRTTNIRVQPADPLRIEPGAYARLVRPPHLFEIHNAGNAPEAVTVSIDSEHGWVDARTEDMIVAPGAHEGVPIETRIPEQPGVPSEAVQVEATLANQSATAAVNSTELVIVDEDPPELLEANLSSVQEATIPFPVTAVFQDAVGVRDAWITVEPPNGGTERVPMHKGQPGHFHANVTVDTIGEAHLRLNAVDRSSENNTYEDPDPRTVELTYDRRPTIDLVHPQDGALRAGDRIQLDIEDEAGFAAINATVRGEDVSLMSDQSIDTTGWREDTYRLHVTAENRFGLTNQTTYDVTIDNTPPNLEDAHVTPRNPDPGELVTLTATLGEGGSNVTTLIQPPNEPPQEIMLHRQDNRTYQATTQLPAGTYEVTFLAEDAAGNEATPETPIELEVGAGAGIPLALPALAPLAAALLHRSRSRRPRP